MGRCRQCGSRPAGSDLCEACRRRLDRCAGLLPAHVIGRNRDGDAWLIDPWGRAHPVDAGGVEIGRDRDQAIALLHETVSRRHARVARAGDGRWRLEDLESKNGVTIDERRVDCAATLPDRGSVIFGKVPMWFAIDLGERIAAGPVSTVAADFGPALVAVLVSAAGVRLELRSSTPDGPGVAAIAGGSAAAELSVPRLELALLALLAERAAAAGDRSRIARCVETRALAAALPFRSDYADDQNVRQLVRRTRALLSSVGIDDLIESHPPHGYMIAWDPTRF